jgi:hypothetical protein
MIVLEIDIEDIARGTALEAERKPHVAADRHGESPGADTLEFMKSAGAAQIDNARRFVDRVEHQAHPVMKFCPDAAGPPGKEDLFHAFVCKGLDRQERAFLS